MTWEHDALAADLAHHLRSDKRMVWTDMQLGPSGSPRPDVYTLERSYSRPMPTAYEVKISRSDLRSDTTSGKWMKYLEFAGAVIFAVPEGLCTPADIPAACGLIVRKANSWRHIRKATRTSCALPMNTCMKLLIDGVHRTVAAREPQPRKVETWRDHEAVRRKFGDAVARAARDIVAAQTEATNLAAMRKDGWERVDREIAAHKAYLMDQAKRSVGEYEAVKRELLNWLSLDEMASVHAIRRKISELRVSCSADHRVREAEVKVSQARRALTVALAAIPEPAAQTLVEAAA